MHGNGEELFRRFRKKKIAERMLVVKLERYGIRQCFKFRLRESVLAQRDLVLILVLGIAQHIEAAVFFIHDKGV